MRFAITKEIAMDLYESGQLLDSRGKQCIHCGHLAQIENRDKSVAFWVYSYWSVEDGKCNKCGATDHPVAPQNAWFEAIGRRGFAMIERDSKRARLKIAEETRHKRDISLEPETLRHDQWSADLGPIQQSTRRESQDHSALFALAIFAIYALFALVAFISRG